MHRRSSRRFSDSVDQDITGFPIVTRHLVALTMRHIAKQQLCLIPWAHPTPRDISALNRDDSIHKGNVSRDFDSWLTFFVILQAALYALEDGGMSVERVEHKHFMAALSTVKPSLTTEQLEQFKLMQR